MLIAVSMPFACSKIADFEDLTADCPSGNVVCDQHAGKNTGGRTGATGGASNGGTAADSSDGAGGTTETGGVTAGGSGGSGAGAAGATANGGDAGDAECRAAAPGLHGPEMALVRRTDRSHFWIDETEVTNGQFAEFLGTSPVNSDPVCQGAPPGAPFLCEAKEIGADDLPRTCVDWCDAEAYCIWAGKELCDDRNNVSPDARDALLAASDFFAACSPTPDVKYGCGTKECGPADCNGLAAGKGMPLPVGAETNCCVPDACSACSIHDLSGNVAEWTNGCDTNEDTGKCVVRGGRYDSPAQSLECGAEQELLRRTKYDNVGFRCCVHPAP